MKIYLDTNVICRPFDDHTQERIAKEITAISELFIYISGKIFDVVISDIVLS